MGNNASRAAAPSQQQQQHQPHSHHQHNPSNASSVASSASSPPTNVPTRVPSNASRRPSRRRNSLQPTPTSPSGKPPAATLPTAIPFDASALTRPRQESISDAHYIPQDPYSRRGSVADSPAPSANMSTATVTAAAMTPSRDIDYPDDAGVLKTPTKIYPSTCIGTGNSTPTTTASGIDDFPTTVDGAAMAAAVGEAGDTLMKRASMGSTTTVDEDEVDVADTRTIPTMIQWPHGGSKVYVMGTFSGWRKRYKLTKSPSDAILSAVIPLPPGTHHLKFFVDGDMRTSDALPTAVDDTGILVNYLEVNADDMPPLDRQPSRDSQQDAANASASQISTTPAPPKKKRYTDDIPPYLREFVESYGEEDDGKRVSETNVPSPPSLPMMLQKVILNTNSTMKDDASVLGIPNHVVLNHLATSSIKNQVLAVSATTRYKKKYVSTILYKTTNE